MAENSVWLATVGAIFLISVYGAVGFVAFPWA
jgi:hypothetical protein